MPPGNTVVFSSIFMPKKLVFYGDDFPAKDSFHASENGLLQYSELPD